MRRFALLIFLACAVVSFASRASGDTFDTVTLHHADFAVTDSAVPPDAGWQPVTLPDSWRVRHPDLSGYAWYRIVFTLKTVPTQPLALYVPHVSLVATFWLNGSLLNPGAVFDHDGGKMGSPMSDQPLYLVLPSGLFHPGENVLDIRLQGDRRIRSGLSAPMLGPTSDLEPRWTMRYTLQVAIPNAILVIVAGALCFFIGHLHHQRRFHLIQLAMAAGIVTAISYLTLKLPIGREANLLLRVAGNIVLHWALVVAAYRMTDGRIKGFLALWHAVTVLTVIAVVWCAAVGAVTDRIWMLTWPHLLLRFVVVFVVLQKARRDHSIMLAVLAITAAFWLLTLVQSYLLLMDVLPWDHFRTSSAGFGPFGIAMLFFWAGQFILDREQAALAQHGAITAERSRILQEMHDGMGTHLIAALHLARRGDAARHELIGSIEESLYDLRSIIDTLDLADQDLLPLLANLRFRLEPRLKALGIELAWDVATPFPEVKGLTPQTALGVLRIVQESINNVIQHAKASAIRFAAHAEGAELCIKISDDGCGFDAPNVRSGARGLTGMRMRAESLQGAVRIYSDVGGTTVELRIPRVQESELK